MLRARLLLTLLLLAAAVKIHAATADYPAAPAQQSAAAAEQKSIGCNSCHSKSDAPTMHPFPGVNLGCVDCHGGDATVVRPADIAPGTDTYRAALRKAHVLPRWPQAWDWPSSANPARSYTLLNRESPAYVRFINPGDLRAADAACGACHQEIVEAAKRSLMATNAMFWGGAGYNNGLVPYKHYVLGESYTDEGKTARIVGPVKPDANMSAKGILPELWPLPNWETMPTPDIFRVFERGGRTAGTLFPDPSLPNDSGGIEKLQEPGRPDIHSGNRGNGTGNRIAISLLNLYKTRLNDPSMWFLGTNDQPGDYRSSGCSACHVVYANDADPVDSGPYARYGHWGQSASVDPTISHNHPAHPLFHKFTLSIPTSQCMVCHMHQPNMFMNSYLGYTMWDYEADAPAMWPKQQHNPTPEETRRVNDRDPEGAVMRGNWRDLNFLANSASLNPKLHDTHFADYHGHGWMFRAVYERDRQGNLLDVHRHIIPESDPHKLDKAVQLMDIHAEKGMQCVDCHFAQDSHGNGHIYGEVAQAVEIDCVDCHGSVDRLPVLRTSGPAAPPGGTDLSTKRTPFGALQFEWIDGSLWQRSLVTPALKWRIKLVRRTVTPGDPDYDAKAARAKLMSTDTKTQAWGLKVAQDKLAHPNDLMTCQSCHSSWTPSCSGCHLPTEANWKTAKHHYDDELTRNYATYNPQIARADMYMLGIHGPAKGDRIAPMRSSSAVMVSSSNANRDIVYTQQVPISAAGFSSQAFAPHFPHTVRTVETKQCEDCHLSKENDNNATMAQLLMLGTGYVNFIGYHAWLGGDGGISAVRVTHWTEPQAVIGSYLERYVYPDDYAMHQAKKDLLQFASNHGAGDVGCLQLRGEYLYSAEGRHGMRVYDVASIGNKDVSQHIITAPFSPLGQQDYIKSSDATCVALPTDQPVDPRRDHGKLMRELNEEQPMHPIYNYAVVTDAREGLILTNVDTLADREPRNNFLTRALTYNPGGILNGARYVSLGGYYAYVASDAGLVVVNLDSPLEPRIAAVLPIKDLRAFSLQFRYLFVVDGAGLEVVDVTHPGHPHLVSGARVPFQDAHRIYVARTYAYVAAGRQGLGIVDVTRPEQPKLYRMFDAAGKLHNTRDVVIGAAYDSAYAYVADATSGLAVVQLTAPDTQPRFFGFSPAPEPQLIARYATPYPATCLSRGLERDRAVDETGNQIAVFGRIGSRPFTLPEMQKLFLDNEGNPWFTEN
ncbi:MAG: hypothetical protein ACRETO_08400 [Gammaproteobacteria bacterium]